MPRVVACWLFVTTSALRASTLAVCAHEDICHRSLPEMAMSLRICFYVGLAWAQFIWSGVPEQGQNARHAESICGLQARMPLMGCSACSKLQTSVSRSSVGKPCSSFTLTFHAARRLSHAPSMSRIRHTCSISFQASTRPSTRTCHTERDLIFRNAVTFRREGESTSSDTRRIFCHCLQRLWLPRSVTTAWLR